jgi:hypothetical protein
VRWRDYEDSDIDYQYVSWKDEMIWRHRHGGSRPCALLGSCVPRTKLKFSSEQQIIRTVYVSRIESQDTRWPTLAAFVTLVLGGYQDTWYKLSSTVVQAQRSCSTFVLRKSISNILHAVHPSLMHH